MSCEKIARRWYESPEKFDFICVLFYFSMPESENKPGMEVRYGSVWIRDGINLVCKYDIEFCGENERKRYVTCMTVLKFVAWLASQLSLHELKMVSVCQPWEKEQNENQRFQKFVILQLRLFENHSVVAKVISLFVEKKLPPEYLFLSWKKLLEES